MRLGRAARAGFALLAVWTASALVPPAGAATKVVYAGAPKPDDHLLRKAVEVVGFYPRDVTVHAGDRVRWEFTSPLHMVTVPAVGAPNPLFGWVDFDSTFSGYHDAAGKAMWFDGQLRQIVPHTTFVRDPVHVYDGSATRNSGLPVPRPRPYTLTFTKPGVYRYACLTHPSMSGTVTVIPKGQPIETPAEDLARARADFAQTRTLATRLDRTAAPPPGTVWAGHDAGDVALLKFYPGRARVKVGGSLDFVLRSVKESHDVVFGPAAYRAGLAKDLLQGETLNPMVFLPSDPETAFPPYDGRNHGNGFLNTGALDTDPTTPYDDRQRVTFTKRGRFVYECLIHPGMAAEVDVV